MFDVVVVGAGLSGLQASYHAQRAGLSVVIIEARDRVGGRVCTVPIASNRGVVDLGAAWFDQETQPRVTEYFSIEDRENMAMICDHVEAELLKTGIGGIQEDAVSVDDYVRKMGANDKTAKMASFWTRAFHGLESTQVPMGCNLIARGIASLIGESKILLSEPVTSIKNEKTHVATMSASGKVTKGRKCIVSNPSVLLADIVFTPSLPASYRDLSTRMTLGHFYKSIVCYDRPWWREEGYNGSCVSYIGPINIVRDSSMPEKGFYALTCLMTGADGQSWSRLAPHDRRHAILTHFAAIFNVGDDSTIWQPMGFFDKIWQYKKYSGGALSPVPRLGCLANIAPIYKSPVGNLYFVGTEYSDDWRNHMEYALISGEKGAREVIQALRQGRLN
ncbi:unnamed protein product [Clonostachys rhizophaga]|uniref:monoamine oxidase n=1 Tax=Clonostachys rhizophaga TaxID=160324 RepID=A0A9N9W070_9HYPO|nr:unnamed protein product [Clonostachys rhizophaga]